MHLETTYLEYYEPAGTIDQPIIQISQVAYVFRGVEDFVNPLICQYLIDTGWHRVQKKTPYNSFWSR